VVNSAEVKAPSAKKPAMPKFTWPVSPHWLFSPRERIA
jgi:hypothetical protein